GYRGGWERREVVDPGGIGIEYFAPASSVPRIKDDRPLICWDRQRSVRPIGTAVERLSLWSQHSSRHCDCEQHSKQHQPSCAWHKSVPSVSQHEPFSFSTEPHRLAPTSEP